MKGSQICTWWLHTEHKIRLKNRLKLHVQKKIRTLTGGTFCISASNVIANSCCNAPVTYLYLTLTCPYVCVAFQQNVATYSFPTPREKRTNPVCLPLKKEEQWLCLHVAITNMGSSAKVKEKAMIRNLSKAGGAGVSISTDNVMWHGQILEPVLL